jgi:hypothetical protein
VEGASDSELNGSKCSRNLMRFYIRVITLILVLRLFQIFTELFLMSVLTKTPCRKGRIQVLWGLKLLQFLGLYFRKRIQNHEYKIR